MAKILGIDPGFSGALAIYDTDDERIVACVDMPVLTQSKKKTEVDASSLVTFISNHASYLKLAVVERVYSMPGQNIQSMFRFGYGAGMIHGVLYSHGVDIKFMQPSVWKGVLGLSQDKNKSRELASKLFPEDAHLFKRAKDDGRAEAVLLSYLGGLLLRSNSKNKLKKDIS